MTLTTKAESVKIKDASARAMTPDCLEIQKKSFAQ